jgi:hypothetical protein
MDEMIVQLAIAIAVQLAKGDLGSLDHNRAFCGYASRQYQREGWETMTTDDGEVGHGHRASLHYVILVHLL